MIFCTHWCRLLIKHCTPAPALLFSTPFGGVVPRRLHLVPFLYQVKKAITWEEGLLIICKSLGPRLVLARELAKPKWSSFFFFKVRFPFYYYYACQESTGKIFICIKTYIRREKKRQTRVCPTKGFFEPSSIPLSSSLPHSPQRWNLGSRLNGSRLLMEHISPEHTSRRLARH